MSEIPWWGWLIIAVVALVVAYVVIGLIFFRKVSKRAFRTFDEVSGPVLNQWPLERNDPFPGRSPYFESADERIKRMTARKPWPPE